MTVSVAATTASKVKHFVVLVLENRSFDHMLGNLMSADYPIDGLKGDEFNYSDPVQQTGIARVTSSAPYVPDVNPGPGHEFHDVMLQLFRQFTIPRPVVGHNDGFAYDYAKITQDVAHADRVMECFGAGQLPALHTLAKAFAVCDRWYSSLPGPTWPNRFFIHAATSGGFVDNALREYQMRTIFQNLSEESVSWRIYYHDIPQSLALSNLRQYAARRYELIDAFFRDCKSGLLPSYSFIEPRYFNLGASRANDQHAPHGVVLGDALIAEIYEALRASPCWPESLLLITWDEHGGFYDHVLPPATVNPDGKVAPEFDFTLLGVRVPAVLVSPYIPARTIDHTTYEHASIAATLKSLFGLPSFLTNRDAQANTFDRVLTREQPRTDTPVSLPRISVAEATPASPSPGFASELHASLTKLAELLEKGVASIGGLPASEDEAAARMLMSFESYLGAST